MKKIVTFLCAIALAPYCMNAQTSGVVNGAVKSKNTQEPLLAVQIMLQGADTIFTQTDENGNFSIEAPTGTYNVVAQIIGFSPVTLFNINVNAGNAQVLLIELEEQPESLKEVVIKVKQSAGATDRTTPLSTQKLTSEEIRANPGGNFDVSRVIQVLPGVAGGTSPSRNDIIVRGGGPSENVYYLDGIEIPVLNHFQTQGASGGATGILNVSFINDVQLTSSAFDSKYDNALASTFVIKQRAGNPEKLGGNIRLSGTELATTFEGPLGKKTTFLASARRSYLQLLFKLLDLPIRPDYWDFQYKVTHRINKKTELNFIGLGAIDNFKLVAPKDASPENEYILRSTPLLKQWNYTVGVSLKRLINNGYYTVALSRNMLNNQARRLENNIAASGNRLFYLSSNEIENKLRLDINKFNGNWKISYGLGAQYVKYDADLFNTIRLPITDANGNIINPALTIQSNTTIDFYKMGGYIHASNYFLNEQLLVSAGLRTDINTFTANGLNPLQTLSPRLSMSYALDRKWNVSASLGSYYKLPAYTSLGYRNELAELVNKDLKYINAIHYTAGLQFLPRNDFRFTVETFYKQYRNYPVSLSNGTSIANIGTEFSAIGNDDFASTGKGRVYGVEGYVQQKLVRNIFYVLSATVYKSEFSGADGVLKPSTWDYGYIVSTTLGYKFTRNWDVGAKYRIAGGQPYTPFALDASRAQYLATGRGELDYSRLNTERLPLFQQLDVRVDKKINFKKASLILFADFQNILAFKTASAPSYTFTRNEDNSAFATTDGNSVASDGKNAIPIILSDPSATVVPTIGFIFEF